MKFARAAIIASIAVSFVALACGIAAVLWISAPPPRPPAVRPAPQTPLPPLAPAHPRETAAAGGPFVEKFQTFDEVSRWYVSDGWSNGAWMSSEFLRSHLALSPQGLVATLSRTPPDSSAKSYAGAEFRTRQPYGYGYFEGRMTAPRGPGTVIALFTYRGPEPAHRNQEIDIELLGDHTRTVDLTIHQGQRTENVRAPLGFDAAEGFHTYAFDWRPHSIRWYADGVLIHESHGQKVPIPDLQQQFFFDLWNSTMLYRWVGPIDERYAPWVVTISCMAYAERYEGKPLCS